MRPYPVDSAAEHKRALRRTLRRYALIGAAMALGLAWAFGYAKGAIDGYREGLTVSAHKESNK